MKRVATVAAVCLLALALAADSFRSAFAGTLTVDASLPDGDRRGFKTTDSLGIRLEGDLRFLLGVELELKCPKAAAAAPGALSFQLWSELSPAPDPAIYAYAGTRLVSQAVGPRLSYVFQIPLRKDHGLKAGPYAAIIPAVLSRDSFPLAAKLLPASKDLPYDLEVSEFSLRARPLISDEGALTVVVRFPEGASAAKATPAVLVDERRSAASGEEMLLKAGVHAVRVACEGFREENRSVTVEAGKTGAVEVLLEDIAPRVIVEAPEGAVVTVDGARVDKAGPEGFIVEPGERLIGVKVGDYSLTRKIVVERGKHYRIAVKLDLAVVEE